MYSIHYALMCLLIGVYLYFHLSGVALPPYFDTARLLVAWGFLLWAVYGAGRIMVDCILLYNKGEMTSMSARNGFLLALMHHLPFVLMSLFLLQKGYETK
ncbi:MAG: hypothetical protein JNL02_10450 [Saprospiraceae bacterium]|nr:hypothetical protein [Saprospiraceae bacterium]